MGRIVLCCQFDWKLRELPGGNCPKAKYEIISNTKSLHDCDWGRVVADVCSGHAWQFEDWPLYI